MGMDDVPNLRPKRSVRRVIFCEDNRQTDVVDFAFKVAQKSVSAVTHEVREPTTPEATVSVDPSNDIMQRRDFSSPTSRPRIDVDPKKYDPGKKERRDCSGMKFMKFEKGFGNGLESDGEGDAQDGDSRESVLLALARSQSPDRSGSHHSLSPIYEPSANQESDGHKFPTLPSSVYGGESEEPYRRHPLSTSSIGSKFPPRKDSLEHYGQTQNPNDRDSLVYDETGRPRDQLAGRTAVSPRAENAREPDAKTVFTDPRARDLPFMQPSSTGWTPHLDEYVHSRQQNVGRTSGSSTAIPFRGSSKHPSNTTVESSKHSSQHSHPTYEHEGHDAGFTRIQRIFHERSSNTSSNLNKSLPSPPIATLSTEIPSELKVQYGHAPQAYHRRAETAPNVPTPFAAEFDEVTPHLTTQAPSGIRAYPTEYHAALLAHREGSAVRRGPSYETGSPREFEAFDHPARSRPSLDRGEVDLDRKPSRLDRLREKLSRSPDRRGRSPVRRGCGREREGLSPNRQLDRIETSPVRRTGENQPPLAVREDKEFDERYYAYRPAEALNDHFSSPGRGRSYVDVRRDARPRITKWPSSMQGNPEKLWGEKGILARPERSPSNRRSRESEKKRGGSLKGMAEKLMQTGANLARKHSSTSRSASPAKHQSTDPHAPLPSAARFPISLSRAEQMRLFGEVEYLLQTLVNDFLLDQLSGHRLSLSSLQSIAKKWASRGRAQVLDMCWDLRTQLELVQLNLNNVHFHGSAPATQHRRFCLVYAWKDVARELSVRSFCSADSAVRKMLSDCYIILDMLGAPGSWWLILQKLHVEALDKMKRVQGEKERARKERKERAEWLGKPRTVVLGSPLHVDGEMEAKMTRRMALEMEKL